MERVVRTDGKFCCEKRLAKRIEPPIHKLQEGFVPNAPAARIGIAGVAIFVLPIIVVEAHFVGKGVEAHRTILGVVEKGRVVTGLPQDFRQRGHPVAGIGRGDKRLTRAGDGAEQGRHRIHRLRPAGISLREHVGMCQERIDKRRVARITRNATVQTAHPFFGHALPNDHHHIASFETSRPLAVGCGATHRTEVTLRLLLGEKCERLHACFAHSAQQSEWGVEHQGLLLRFVAIKRRVVRSQRPQITVSAPHSTETQPTRHDQYATAHENPPPTGVARRAQHEKAVEHRPHEGDQEKE